jgi:hypothetical protein
MVEALVGTWNLDSSENWEEYMKELGVGLIQRKAAAAIKPTVVISNNGTQWNLKLQTSLKNTDLTCNEGVEFTESKFLFSISHKSDTISIVSSCFL